MSKERHTRLHPIAGQVEEYTDINLISKRIFKKTEKHIEINTEKEQEETEDQSPNSSQEEDLEINKASTSDKLEEEDSQSSIKETESSSSEDEEFQIENSSNEVQENKSNKEIIAGESAEEEDLIQDKENEGSVQNNSKEEVINTKNTEKEGSSISSNSNLQEEILEDSIVQSFLRDGQQIDFNKSENSEDEPDKNQQSSSGDVFQSIVEEVLEKSFNIKKNSNQSTPFPQLKPINNSKSDNKSPTVSSVVQNNKIAAYQKLIDTRFQVIQSPNITKPFYSVIETDKNLSSNLPTPQLPNTHSESLPKNIEIKTKNNSENLTESSDIKENKKQVYSVKTDNIFKMEGGFNEILKMLHLIPEFCGKRVSSSINSELEIFLQHCRDIYEVLNKENQQIFLKLIKQRLRGDTFLLVRNKDFRTIEEFECLLRQNFTKTNSPAEIMDNISKMVQKPNEDVLSYAQRIKLLMEELIKIITPSYNNEELTAYKKEMGKQVVNAFKLGLINPQIQNCLANNASEDMEELIEIATTIEKFESQKLLRQNKDLEENSTNKINQSVLSALIEQIKIQNNNSQNNGNNKQNQYIRSNNQNCDFCQRRGHSIQNCLTKQRTPFCQNCRTYGHNQNNCPRFRNQYNGRNNFGNMNNNYQQRYNQNQQGFQQRNAGMNQYGNRYPQRNPQMNYNNNQLRMNYNNNNNQGSNMMQRNVYNNNNNNQNNNSFNKNNGNNQSGARIAFGEERSNEGFEQEVSGNLNSEGPVGNSPPAVAQAITQ